MARKPTTLTDFVEAKTQQTAVSSNATQKAVKSNQKVSKEKIMVTLPRQESKGKLKNGKAVMSKEARSDWVDCDKIPESKKAIRKYDGGGNVCDKSHRKPHSSGEVRGESPSIHTLSGTQIGRISFMEY